LWLTGWSKGGHRLVVARSIALIVALTTANFVMLAVFAVTLRRFDR
jgi:hypothetical protein